MNAVSQDRVDAFWARLVRLPSGCWEFPSAQDAWGYGHFHWDGRARRAHRIAYTLVHGPIPADRVVMHSCDNPPCCNPDHLSLGTVAENNRDRHIKGRTVMPYQEPREFRPHGTRGRFRSGCRCDVCRAGERDRKRPVQIAYRARKRQSSGATS